MPSSSNPVAMTVTITSSLITGLITAPKMILAAGSTSALMIAEASLSSLMPRSFPPVMFNSTARAPLIEPSSSSGLAIAFCAASVARMSPRATPVPMTALPRFDITVLTSAKSTFT